MQINFSFNPLRYKKLVSFTNYRAFNDNLYLMITIELKLSNYSRLVIIFYKYKCKLRSAETGIRVVAYIRNISFQTSMKILITAVNKEQSIIREPQVICAITIIHMFAHKRGRSSNPSGH